MRVSVVPGKLMLLIGKDTLKVFEGRIDLKNNIGMFPGARDFEGKVLRESRAGHLMVPLLPESFWEFHDSFVPSETAGPLVFPDENKTTTPVESRHSPNKNCEKPVLCAFGEKQAQKASTALCSAVLAQSGTDAVEESYPTPHIHEQMTTSNYGYDTAYNFTHNNIMLEPNAMNNIDTVAHMNVHNTQY